MVVLSEFVEGPSSSSSIDRHNYDVFLSFKGLDTRRSFTDHLYKALLYANISTFLGKGDEEIETTDDPKPDLESAIKESRASIIVLSKNYANSPWCLDELVLILEQRRTSNQIVIPIFYHVERTDVRKQQSTFGDAIAEHNRKMETETDANRRSQLAQKIERWKKALTEVADLKGENVNGRRETKFIEEIVKDISRRLHISSWSPLQQLFGMDYSIKFVTSWLKDASSHMTDILTILGMAGIGKTSLAKYVYGLHSHEFETSSFIEDISRRCDEKFNRSSSIKDISPRSVKFNGLLYLQKQLYDDISEPSSVEAHDASTYTTMIENVVKRKKIFLVLDDIDSLDQLDALLGSKGFHLGSKIIITTKDARLTERYALFKTNFKPRHEKHFIYGLCETESQKLLCFHAFMSNDPEEGYEEVSKELVKYCQGHPFALEVLGKSLHNRSVAYWEECLEGLKKEYSSPIINVLRKSFDSLPSENDKDLFKHIACFFVGMDRNVTETILNACGINTRSGIANLIDRCLLSIARNNELVMHRLLQEMGRFIVREESPGKPWKRTRVWCHEESFEVLKQKKGSREVLGLSLDMKMLEDQKLHHTFKLETDAFTKMYNLMLLQLNYVQINGSYENFPKELRWLCMHGFPLKFIPSDLPMENLVALDMSHSNIESIDVSYDNQQGPQKRTKMVGSWSKDKKLLGSLKILNLSSCDQLRRLDGFEKLPALERLIVRSCIALVEVCESIRQCVELVLIDLSYCKKLEKLPRTIAMLKKVETILLDGCDLGESRIRIMGNDSPDMVKANNIGINTKASSSSILDLIPNLELFANSLPSSLVTLSFSNNNLYTESFPMDLSRLSTLKDLYLDGNPIDSLPSFVRSLPNLEILSMTNCKMLTSVEHPPHTLKELILHFDFDSDSKPLLRKVVFDPEMSPLKLSFDLRLFIPSSFEIEGMVKIQPIVSVEEKVLHGLGWTNLHFLDERRMGTFSQDRGSEESQIQMYYEFGIFSTIFGGKEMPNWITNRSNGSSISFTIPSSPNNLTGLNFCSVQAFVSLKKFLELPVIIIKNITKNHTWIYKHCIGIVTVGGEGYILLSHWMFGKNEMEGGDEVTITVIASSGITKECGVSFVYEDGKTDEEEDALGYYKSWNHIIGGDLTGFQLTTGEYILHTWRFMPTSNPVDFIRQFVRCGITDGASFKESKVCFRALSQRKSNMLDQTHKNPDHQRQTIIPYIQMLQVSQGGATQRIPAYAKLSSRTSKSCNKHTTSAFGMQEEQKERNFRRRLSMKSEAATILKWQRVTKEYITTEAAWPSCGYKN